MARQSPEQIIPLDFAEAFADAVLVYEIWSPVHKPAYLDDRIISWPDPDRVS